MEDIPLASVVATVGFVIGLAFGATVQRTNFCSMGAISDIVFMGDWSRFRAWMLALAVAVIGAQALHGLGAVDLGESIYPTANLGWLGAIAGGLLFGFGMTQTGGCGGRTLVRIGAGNLKCLVVAIGQGIVGLSTLAFGSLLALLSITAGAVYGVKYLGEGSLGGAISAMFERG